MPMIQLGEVMRQPASGDTRFPGRQGKARGNDSKARALPFEMQGRGQFWLVRYGQERCKQAGKARPCRLADKTRQGQR